MGTGVYDMVMGFDEAVVNAAFGATAKIWARLNQANPVFTAQDGSGDTWHFASAFGTPTVSLTSASASHPGFRLTIPGQTSASDTTDSGKASSPMRRCNATASS